MVNHNRHENDFCIEFAIVFFAITLCEMGLSAEDHSLSILKSESQMGCETDLIKTFT